MGYTKDAIKGISWIAALRVSTRAITLVRIAILARLLTPSQFGVFGIASLILAFLEVLTETGINVFLIQEEKEVKYFNSAWLVSIVRGIVLTLIIIFLTPLIISFFNAPEAYTVLLLIALVPFVRGFINPAIITLQKELQFKKEFYFRLIIFLFDSSIVSLTAFVSRNPLSFVWGIMAGALLEVILSFIFIRPTPRINIEGEKIKKIIHRGKWVTLSGIFTYLAQEGDNLVVGKFLGTGSLGIYQNAYKLSTLPISEITDVISKVVFPVYTKIARDRRRLLSAFRKTLLINSFAVIILSMILFILAEPIILALLGNRWEAAIPVVRILSIYGALRAIFGSVSPLYLAVGKQEYVASMTFARVLGLVIAIIPLTLQYGLIGAGYAALFSVFIEIPIIIFYTVKVFKTH